MKFFDIIKSASANLLRNKGRTALTIIAIFIGAFTISITSGINVGVNDYIDQQVGSVGGENQLFIQVKSENNQSSGDGPAEYNAEKGVGNEISALSDKDIKKIKKIKNIEEAKAFRMVTPDYIQGKNDKKYVLSTNSPSDITIDTETGREVDKDGEEYEINLAPEYIESLGFSSAEDAINQKVKIGVSSQATGEQEEIEAVVVGVRTNSLIQGGQAIVNYKLANKIVEINEKNMPENMTGIFYIVTATMKDNLSEEEVTAIKNQLGKDGYVGQTVEDEIGMIRNVINAITSVLTMFGAIALLAASFGIINTLYMSVQERTREIGLMKAMGLSSGKVFAIFSVEAALIGFLGSIIGILGAIGMSSIINKVAADSFLESLTGFTLIQFSMTSTISIILVIMGIAFLAGTLPARKAAKLDPIEALRYE